MKRTDMLFGRAACNLFVKNNLPSSNYWITRKEQKWERSSCEVAFKFVRLEHKLVWRRILKKYVKLVQIALPGPNSNTLIFSFLLLSLHLCRILSCSMLFELLNMCTFRSQSIYWKTLHMLWSPDVNLNYTSHIANISD